MAKGSIYYNRPRTAPGDVTDPVIPLSHFIKYRYMSANQALSLFLVDELGLTFTDAAALFGRCEGSVRLSYIKGDDKRKQYLEMDAKKKRKIRQPAEIK